MMRPTLSRRDRRVLSFGVVTITTLILGARGVPAGLRWQREARLAALETEAELARAQANVRDAPAMRDSLAAREKRFIALAPTLLAGDTPAAAGATLASLVSGAAATADVRLGAVQVRTDSASHDVFTRVGVRASVTGDVHGLTQLLLSLERGPTLLAVRSLSVTQPAPSAPATQPEALQIELLIEGLALNHPSAMNSPKMSSAARDSARGAR